MIKRGRPDRNRNLCSRGIFFASMLRPNPDQEFEINMVFCYQSNFFGQYILSWRPNHKQKILQVSQFEWTDCGYLGTRDHCWKSSPLYSIYRPWWTPPHRNGSRSFAPTSSSLGIQTFGVTRWVPHMFPGHGEGIPQWYGTWTLQWKPRRFFSCVQTLSSFFCFSKKNPVPLKNKFI